MESRLFKGCAAACGVAALLVLGGCGDRSGESAAQREARTATAQEAQSPMRPEDAAARAAAQRAAAAGIAQGGGS